MKTSVRILNWPWEEPERLVLKKDYVWDSGKRGVNWKSKDGFLVIVDGVWTIKAGYVWDDATFAWSGPKDKKTGYPQIAFATLIHDVGYGYLNIFNPKKFPYTREEIDKYFYDEMNKVDFPLADEYYSVVKKVGGTFKIISNILKFFGIIKDRKKS